MRVVYFGSGEFGLPTLAALAARHQVVGVVTQPDRPAGRGGRISPTAVGTWGAENFPGAPIFKPAKVNTPETIEAIRALDAQAWVVIAFGQKLPRALLEGKFAINLHASLLPRWRGAAPINAAILAGDEVTGNTVITLADRMDAGLILGQTRREVGRLQTAGELHDLLSADGPALVMEVLEQFQRGALKQVEQDETKVTIATKLSRDFDSIDFQQPAEFLRRYVHAMTPWPGVTAVLIDPASVGTTATLKLVRVKPVERAGQEEPGVVVDAGIGATGAIVRCGGGTALELLGVQPAGKRVMGWGEFVRGAGRWIKAGARVRSAKDAA